MSLSQYVYPERAYDLNVPCMEGNTFYAQESGIGTKTLRKLLSYVQNQNLDDFHPFRRLVYSPYKCKAWYIETYAIDRNGYLDERRKKQCI